MTAFTTFIGPPELADVEKNGTTREQRLAKHIRACWNRIASTELFVAELRAMLHQAVELEAGPDDLNETPKTQEEEDAAIEQFVHRARAVAATATGKEAFVRWNRMLQAAAIIAAGGKAREYYVEVAREVLSLPAKDSAARGLAKIDIDRAAAAATVVVEPLLFDARYFVSVDPDEAPPEMPAPPAEPPTDPTPPTPPEESPP
jgi:hypothetical protein